MRDKVRKQLRIVEPSISHEHAFELLEMRRIVSENIAVLDLVHADLVRGLRNPETGRDGMMSAEQVFLSMIVKQMNGYSYEALAFHLEDSKSYRHFCGFGIGDEVPSKSTLQRDIKRVRPETMEEINRVLVSAAVESGIEKGRSVRVDCTVVESNIHYPTDSSLLEDVVRVLVRLISRYREQFDLDSQFVNHLRRAKKRAMEILNGRNAEARLGPYKDLIEFTGRTISYAQKAVEQLGVLSPVLGQNTVIAQEELQQYIDLGKQVLSQATRRILLNETVPSSEKLVSIFEPHTDIIRKDRRDTYYGHKVAVTGGVSGMLTDLVIWKGNPPDSSMATEMAERQIAVFGRVPRQATFDGGFASKDNLADIKALGVTDVAFSKRRGIEIHEMTRSTWVYKRLRDFRAGIEGMISFLKRAFGMTRCTWRGLESFKAYAWTSVVSANLLLLARRRIA
jgi:IS5 family transposase